MAATLPEEIIVVPRSDTLHTHAGFSYKQTAVYTSRVAQHRRRSDSAYTMPNECAHRVFVLGFEGRNYDFNRRDTVQLLVVPEHSDPNTVVGFTAYTDVPTMMTAITSGNLGPNGEIMNHELSFVALTAGQVMLLPPTHNSYQEGL